MEDYTEDVKVKNVIISKDKKDFIWNLFNFQPCFICPYSLDRCNETNPTNLNPQHCRWLTSWMNESIRENSFIISPIECTFEDKEKI